MISQLKSPLPQNKSEGVDFLIIETRRASAAVSNR